MKLTKSSIMKFFLIAGGFILSLIAIIAVAYTILNIKWGGELEAELNKLRAAGEPMTLKEVIPSPLPPQDNACIEYQQIFTLMTDGTFSMRGSGDDSKDMKEIGDICFSGKTMDEFEAQCRKNSEKINAILEKDSLKQIFELCGKAALKPGINFNLNYDEGLALLLPHLSKIRSIARLLRVKAEMELIDGQREKAYETMLTSLKLAGHFKSDPLLISQLVYFACYNICFEFITYNLPRTGISDEQAARLFTELAPEKTAYLASVRKAIDLERICLGGWAFERLLSGNIKPEEVRGMIDSNDFGTFIVTSFLFRPFAKKDYLEYLKMMEEYKDQYKQPYYKITFNLLDEEKSLGGLPAYCILTRMICPGLGEVRLKTAEIETRSQETRIRLALEEYKNLKGAYPDKIDLLAPQFLKEIPLSEMTGRSFDYAKNNDSYKIDGGIPEKK